MKEAHCGEPAASGSAMHGTPFDKSNKQKGKAMKILQSLLFRAACAIITGILLINNPDNTVRWITILIGILFLLSGAISCATYINAKKAVERSLQKQGLTAWNTSIKPSFPIVGIGSVLLGLILALMPDTFITSLMYILGALLVLGAVSQFVTLAGARRVARVPVWFWIAPSVILLTGLFVIIKPMESAAMPLLIIGWCLLLYGITECVNALKIYQSGKRRIGNDGRMAG